MRSSRWFHFGVIFTLASTLLWAAVPAYAVDCWIRELVPAQNDSCDCQDSDCAQSGVSVAPQHYRCAPAGAGESGKDDCSAQSQQIASWYPCETDWYQSTILACIGSFVGSIPACAACVAEPTKLSCIACAAAVAGSAACAGSAAGDLCGVWLGCVKDTDGVQSTYRSIYQSMPSGTCHECEG